MNKKQRDEQKAKKEQKSNNKEIDKKANARRKRVKIR